MTVSVQKTRRTVHVSLIVLSGLIVFALFVGLFGIWLYSGRASAAKLSVFRATGLPVAKVGSEYVSASDIADFTQLSDVLQKQGTTVEQALQLAGVAADKVTVSSADLVSAERSLADDALYQSAVRAAGETAVRNTLVRNIVLEAKLKTWYAQQTELEPTFVARVQQAEKMLASGSTFSQVAEQYSDDSATKWFAGDTGYMPVSALVPEYAAQISDMAAGQQKTVYTRYGAHIVLLREKLQHEGKDMVRLQEVVLTPKGFGDWLLKAEQQLPVVWYMQ